MTIQPLNGAPHPAAQGPAIFHNFGPPVHSPPPPPPVPVVPATKPRSAPTKALAPRNVEADCYPNTRWFGRQTSSAKYMATIRAAPYTDGAGVKRIGVAVNAAGKPPRCTTPTLDHFLSEFARRPATEQDFHVLAEERAAKAQAATAIPLPTSTAASNDTATQPAPIVKVGEIRSSDGSRKAGTITRVVVTESADGIGLFVKAGWPSIVPYEDWNYGMTAEQIAYWWPVVTHPAGTRCTVRPPVVNAAAENPDWDSDWQAHEDAMKQARQPATAVGPTILGPAHPEAPQAPTAPPMNPAQIKTAVMEAIAEWERTSSLGIPTDALCDRVHVKTGIDATSILLWADDLISRGEVHCGWYNNRMRWFSGATDVVATVTKANGGLTLDWPAEGHCVFGVDAKYLARNFADAVGAPAIAQEPAPPQLTGDEAILANLDSFTAGRIRNWMRSFAHDFTTLYDLAAPPITAANVIRVITLRSLGRWGSGDTLVK